MKINVFKIYTLFSLSLLTLISGVRIEPKFLLTSNPQQRIKFLINGFDFRNCLMALIICTVIYLILEFNNYLLEKKGKKNEKK
ncbi:hypothetical protein [Lactococcus petauri]|uniref:Uncharacterized protein n=1 Tax=Lactococcus petauri TaxID=1940789 RepID=A0A252CCI0_9LACT|nr:hypothetical protein [Lactococcus petauri]OUK04049.1 hypothetical protein BZZ03_08245 [Lactococcus petauri]